MPEAKRLPTASPSTAPHQRAALKRPPRIRLRRSAGGAPLGGPSQDLRGPCGPLMPGEEPGLRPGALCKSAEGASGGSQAHAATNSFHFWTMYAFSSISAFQHAMPPMRCS